jgi:hypothetical protein
MSFIKYVKLDEENQKMADALYDTEQATLKLIDCIELTGKNRWFSIGRTDVEKGFMGLRKGITERFKELHASE